MPYVRPEVRRALDTGSRAPHDPGELNYAVTKLVNDYLRRGPVRYASLNEVIGVLECAKQELYRRVVAGHEDDVRALNGDVY